MLRDLLRQSIVHLPAQRDGVGVRKVARAVRTVRHHLHVDADLVHVGQAIASEPLG